MNNIILSLIIVALVVVGVGAVVVTRLPEAPHAQFTIPDAPSEIQTIDTAPAYRPDLTKESVYSQPVLAPTVATTTKITSTVSKPVVSKIPVLTPKPVTLPPSVSATGATTTTVVGSTLLTPITPVTSNLPASQPALTVTPAPASTGLVSIWHPALNTRFQLQFNGTLDMSVDFDAYDVDLFDTPKETIAMLHSGGKKVVCYVSAGSWEDWRPDKDLFPSSVIGKDYEGWPGENWLNIDRIDILGPIMKARLDIAKSKGCDAIDPDNVDVYNVDSGFNLTYAQQITYNKWFATETHQRGMSIGLKNNIDQLADLLEFFDFSILESCHEQGWCDQAKPFVAAGKPVFQIEYSEVGSTLSAICPAAKQRGFNAFIKHRNLDAWIQRCP